MFNVLKHDNFLDIIIVFIVNIYLHVFPSVMENFLMYLFLFTEKGNKVTEKATDDFHYEKFKKHMRRF